MNTKDWNDNKNSIYKILGASNHTAKEIETNDYYATEPKAAELLIKHIKLNNNIWECACGGGHLSRVFEKAGFNVRISDIIYRGYEKTEILDFLSNKNNKIWNGDIVTNPPYKYAQEFIEKALSLIPDGCIVAMFLKIQFLEGKKRKKLFLKNPPKIILVSSSRLLCAKNGKFKEMIAGGGSAVAYGWFVWVKGYKGKTIIRWIN